MGISAATHLLKYHYISLFSRTKQTLLAECLHSTQCYLEVLGSTRQELHTLWGLVGESEMFCFLFQPGFQAEDSYLRWVDSFHLNPGWEPSSQGGVVLGHSAITVKGDWSELLFVLERACWESTKPRKAFSTFKKKKKRLWWFYHSLRNGKGNRSHLTLHHKA